MKDRRKGFSLIEMLVVATIMILLTVVGILNLSTRRGTTELNDAGKELSALLREAQSNSMAQEAGVAWGVRFSNVTSATQKPFAALFKTSYSTANTVTYFQLPPILGYVTSSVASGATVDLTFAQVTGLASASKTISIYIPNQPTKTFSISVASSGAVLY